MSASSAKNPVITMGFEPLPKQEIFSYLVLEDQICKFAWYCGGFGSGKTFIGAQIANRLAAMAPQGRGLIARQTSVDLKATTMKTFWEVTDPRAIAFHNKSEQLITYKNGHEIYYWGLDDIEKLKSLEIGWFWVDEVNETQLDTMRVLQGRLRHKAQPKRVGYITSNSEGKDWTYKLFVKGVGLRRPEDLNKYFVVKAPSNENIYLPDDYLDVLNSYTGDMYKRYVEASFEVFEGQIYPDLKHAIHVIKPFAIPSEWRRIRAIDHGERNPTACLWCAISPSGDLYFYREHREADKFVDYHAAKIAEMSIGESIETTLIDPSVKSVRGKSGRKVDVEYKEEMRTHEQHFKLTFANNDVKAGIARVHRYMRIDPSRIHPVTKQLGSPRMFIFSDLEGTLEEMESYKWKKTSATSENDPDEAPRKRDDHLVDCLRYIIMSRPDISSGSVRRKFKPDNKSDPHGLYLINAQKQFKDILLK